MAPREARRYPVEARKNKVLPVKIGPLSAVTEARGVLADYGSTVLRNISR